MSTLYVVYKVENTSVSPERAKVAWRTGGHDELRGVFNPDQTTLVEVFTEDEYTDLTELAFEDDIFEDDSDDDED